MLFLVYFWICRAGAWLAYRFVWRALTWTLRTVLERRRAAIPYLSSWNDLRLRLRPERLYQSDRTRLFDSVSHPEAIQDRLNRGLPLGDCDDYASYAAAVVSRWPGYETNLTAPFILTVQWFDGWKAKGHAVCAWWEAGDWDDGTPAGFWHVGNWYYGGRVGPFRNLRALVDSIVKDGSAAGRGRLIAYWSVDRLTLRPRMWGPVNAPGAPGKIPAEE